MEGIEYAHGEVFCWQGEPRRPERPFDCNKYQECFCPPIEADPEIAGIGIILAFVGSAVVTIVATFVCLLLQHSHAETSLNPIDRFLRRRLCDRARARLVRAGFDPDTYAGCAFDVVMTLSDQQLVTGIALLVAAVVKLADGSITIYHFNIATDLAWFSGNVHLLALLAIRRHEIGSVKPASSDRRPGRRRHRAQKVSARISRYTRIMLMALLAGLMLYTFWVSGYENWYAELRCPVLCTLPGKKAGSPLQWMVVNFVLILYNYPLNIFLLWRTGSIFWIDRVRPHVFGKHGLVQVDSPGVASAESSSQGKTKKRGHFATWLAWLAEIPQVAFQVLWFTLASELWHVLELLCWFGLGVFWTVADREDGHEQMESKEAHKEDEIGFGQLIALLLLILPLMQVFESYARLSDNHQGVEGQREGVETIEMIGGRIGI